MKAKEKVVMILHGAGTETASIQTVQSIRKGIVTLADDAGKFWESDGRAVEPSPFVGFSKRIIYLEQ